MVALIRSINPALIDLRESLSRDPRQNIELAFEIAHRCLDIPPLLESEGARTECIDATNVSLYKKKEKSLKNGSYDHKMCCGVS